MEVETTSAPKLKRRTPPEIRVRTYIVVPLFAFIIGGALLQDRQFLGAALALAVLGLFFVVNHGMDRGYQLAFDDEQMYQRPKGWRWPFRRRPWYAIRFDEVSRVEAIHGADAGLKAKFFPFEFILIYGRTGAPGDNVVIHPPAFHDGSVKEFLHLFDSKCPRKLPSQVIEYMNSEQPL
jgi:hypothetical protein